MNNVGIRLTLLVGMVFLLFIVACSNSADNQDGGAENSADNQDGESEKPTSLPSIRLYSDSSPLNQKIPANAEIDPSSQQYVNAIVQTAQNLLIQVKGYSSPVYFANANTPRYDVLLPCGTEWELGVTRLKDVPIPGFAEPANDVDGAVAPVGCGEDNPFDQDNNMDIIDLNTGCEYDFWQMRKENGSWVASWGNAISIDGNGIYEKGLSARGSGFAFLAGVIWPHELQQGEIPHALLFALPDQLVRAGGPVPPATESDGESTDPNALPEGARLRLDPSLDLNSLNLTPAERTIAKAMQEYGMFLTDNGGDWGVSLYAVDPRSVRGNPYAGLLPDEDFPVLENIPLDRLQVLKLSPQDPDFEQDLGLPSGGCADFE